MINWKLCKTHKRQYEALCKDCSVMICPSCVIIGEHKKHNIIPLNDAAMYLRTEIFNRQMKGLFYMKYFDSIIPNIQTKHDLLEKNKIKTMKIIEDHFTNIEKVVYIRKRMLIEKIEGYFNKEQQKLFQANNENELNNNLVNAIEKKLNNKDENIGNKIKIVLHIKDKKILSKYKYRNTNKDYKDFNINEMNRGFQKYFKFNNQTDNIIYKA